MSSNMTDKINNDVYSLLHDELPWKRIESFHISRIEIFFILILISLIYVYISFHLEANKMRNLAK